MFTDDIQQAIVSLKGGGIILYPTDTIWGLGCDATNEEAIKRIYAIKRREDSKSMLVLLDEPGRLQTYVREVPEIAWELMEVSVKPLTIIYPEGKNLAPSVVSADGSIGIRIVNDPFCRELIHKFRKPLVSTSANISGTPSPAIFDEISDEIRNLVDYVVKWRQDDYIKRAPSSIIKLSYGGLFKIIR